MYQARSKLHMPRIPQNEIHNGADQAGYILVDEKQVLVELIDCSVL